MTETKIKILVIMLVILLSSTFFEIVSNKIYKKENQGLKDKISELETSLSFEYEMDKYDLQRQFEIDCRYRNYSFYDDNFCCKLINNTRICQDWLTVMSEIPIIIDTHNFISTKNATILVESNYDKTTTVISILKKSYSYCHFHQLDYRWIIDCW